MKNKVYYTILIFGIIAIIYAIVSIIISFYSAESETYDIEQNVCYMPRDCFDTQKDYLNQFPGSYEPREFPECLVYCYK